MDNSTPQAELHSVSPLGGVEQVFSNERSGDTVLKEINALDIVSIATPRGGQSALSNLLEQQLGVALPPVGQVNRAGSTVALLGLQSDQCFLVTTEQTRNPVQRLKLITGDTAYLSDQSDSWVVLEISGDLSHRALERICPIDLSEPAFTLTSVARTSMEHLSVIIEKLSESRFRLYSPRSSANSFLHAVTVSINNVMPNFLSSDIPEEL